MNCTLFLLLLKGMFLRGPGSCMGCSTVDGDDNYYYCLERVYKAIFHYSFTFSSFFIQIHFNIHGAPNNRTKELEVDVTCLNESTITWISVNIFWIYRKLSKNGHSSSVHFLLYTFSYIYIMINYISNKFFKRLSVRTCDSLQTHARVHTVRAQLFLGDLLFAITFNKQKYLSIRMIESTA